MPTSTDATELLSVQDFYIDSEAPVIRMSLNVRNRNYSHTLTIKWGDFLIYTIEGITFSSDGHMTKFHLLSYDQRSAILKKMANTKALRVNFELSTFDEAVQIGNVSTAKAYIRTSSTSSKPTFSGFTFADSRSKTVEITGNDQLLIQSHSLLRVTCDTAVPKNEATIRKYSVTVGSTTVSGESPVVDFGAISLSGSLTITVSAVDSRGYSTTHTQMVQVIPYDSIRLTHWSVRRINDIEESADLSLKGSYSPISVNGIEKNHIDSILYRHREFSSQGEWSAWVSMEMIVADGQFAFIDDSFGSFDPEFAYEIQLSVSDQLTIDNITLMLPKGIPLVAYRKGKIGINTAHPACALDVVGNIQQNGQGVLGFVRRLNEDFDSVVVGGIYCYTASDNLANAPSSLDGFLLVLTWGVMVSHIFIDAMSLYLRTYNPATEKWSSWSQK